MIVTGLRAWWALRGAKRCPACRGEPVLYEDDRGFLTLEQRLHYWSAARAMADPWRRLVCSGHLCAFAGHWGEDARVAVELWNREVSGWSDGAPCLPR